MSRPTAKRDAGDRGVRYDLARFEREPDLYEGHDVPIETRIWNLMSGQERQGVMRVVEISLGSGKKQSELAMLRACARHIRGHVDDYRHVLSRER